MCTQQSKCKAARQLEGCTGICVARSEKANPAELDLIPAASSPIPTSRQLHLLLLRLLSRQSVGLLLLSQHIPHPQVGEEDAANVDLPQGAEA